MAHAKRAGRMPKYRRQPSGRHGINDQAFVEHRGQRYYLGVFDSPESRQAYHQFCAALAQSPATAPLAIGGKVPVDFPIAKVLEAFWDHAEKHYVKDGRPTSEQDNLIQTTTILGDMYGETEAREFGPLRLKTLRQAMIDKGWARTTINQRVGHVRRIFRWAVENELVASSVWHGLQAVAGLQKGRCQAPESKPVPAVDDATIEATLRYLPEVVSDMVLLQRLTGCRPSEVCNLRPCDIDRNDPALEQDGQQDWAYRPARHKTEHHGRNRGVPIDARAQEILARYLFRPAESYCFSPAESEAQRKAELHEARQSKPTPSQRRRKLRAKLPILGDRYNKDSYNRAVRRAIDKANAARRKEAKEATLFPGKVEMLPYWSPNQLRHSWATAARREGISMEVIRAVLGHKHETTSEIYAERDLAKAAAVVRKVGCKISRRA